MIPPPTDPLSRQFIGWGVVGVSYTHLVDRPGDGAASLGYLRRGSPVRILERRFPASAASGESWVLVEGGGGGEGPRRGWLREGVIQVYDNEAQARTAAESMSR